MENEQAEGKKKSSPLIMTIAGVVILTLLGAGGGWLVGGMIAPKIAATEAHATAAAGGHGEKKEEGVEKIAAEPNGIVQLDPITTKGPVEVGLAEDIHQDIMAYVRTVSLQQLEGPRGFQYLKDDIQERVDLRSQGRISKVMFRTFVIE
jgi:flagellar FliL protein